VTIGVQLVHSLCRLRGTHRLIATQHGAPC
jgi:hypothetical protein